MNFCDIVWLVAIIPSNLFMISFPLPTILWLNNVTGVCWCSS
uniref:Uncharacterized protein n=1 Tax=Setaria italica TaxID=4555 RepID=K3Y450_SETIT